MEQNKDLFKPLKEIQFVDRSLLKANDYNPNKVLESNLQLLIQSILTNGFCFPIVCRPDMTIIDGFHRWTVSGREPLNTLLGGKVPIVIVAHEDESKNVYGTITFNRARGTHLLEPMEKIVKELLDKGKSIEEISKETGMKNEEIFRLSKLDRDGFLKVMARRQTYNKAEVIRKA
ncbi:ParB N-terminal domain-containing protein [Bergeyella zoohelcum]|uniref:ParB N-terminal domain-containing protein n=1 Tax=Bergeyella zoohelcum TaxID=1015 RepID=UPI003736E8CF